MLSLSHYPNEKENFTLEATSPVSAPSQVQPQGSPSSQTQNPLQDGSSPAEEEEGKSSPSTQIKNPLDDSALVSSENKNQQEEEGKLEGPLKSSSVGVQTVEEDFIQGDKGHESPSTVTPHNQSSLSNSNKNSVTYSSSWNANKVQNNSGSSSSNAQNIEENNVNPNGKINIPLSIVTLQSILISARAKAASNISPKQLSIYQLSNDIMMLMQESLKSERSAYSFLGRPITNVEGEDVDRIAWWFWIIQRSVEELNPSPGFILPSLKMLRQEISELANVALEVISIQKTIQRQLQRMAGVLNNVFARYEDLFGVKEWESKLDEMRMQDSVVISEKFERWLRKSKSKSNAASSSSPSSASSYHTNKSATPNPPSAIAHTTPSGSSLHKANRKKRKSKSKAKSKMSASNSKSRSKSKSTSTGSKFVSDRPEMVKLTAFESKTLLVQHETREDFQSVSINKLSVRCRKEFIKACLEHINAVLRRSCTDSQRAHEELRKSEREIKYSIDRLVRKLDNLRRNHRFQESNCAILLKRSLNSLGLCLYEFIDIVRFIIKLGRFVLLASEHVLRFANGWSHLCDVAYLSQLDVVLEEFSESESFAIFKCFRRKEKRKMQKKREVIMSTFEEYFQQWITANISTVQVTLPISYETSNLIFGKEDPESTCLESRSRQPSLKLDVFDDTDNMISLQSLRSSRELDVKILARIKDRGLTENDSVTETELTSHKLEAIGIKFLPESNQSFEENMKSRGKNPLENLDGISVPPLPPHK